MSPPQSFEAIIFDLDGTLIDTEPTAAKAVENCFADWGVQLDVKDAAYVTGRSWQSALQFLFRKYRPSVSFSEGLPRIMARYRQLLENELLVVPGSIDAVRALAPRFPLAVVSGSSHDDIEWALGRLKILDQFRFVLGAEDYPRSKPEPDGYLKALQILGVSPANALVFEDSLAGIEAARAAGVQVIAISGTNHFAQDISGATTQIKDLQGITPEWIDTLAARLRVKNNA